MTPAAMHSSASELWITPQDVIERARHVLDGIDVDAASDAEAQKYVRARRYITAEENALSPSTPWVIGSKSQSVFLNPPGGKVGNRSKTALFWERLMEEVSDRRVTHAIFVAFSIEALATCQGLHPMLYRSLCIPRQRLRYISRTDPTAKAPPHGSAIVYVPGTIDRREVFAETFGVLGAVRL